jgi:hypothetical protein
LDGRASTAFSLVLTFTVFDLDNLDLLEPLDDSLGSEISTGLKLTYFFLADSPPPSIFGLTPNSV